MVNTKGITYAQRAGMYLKAWLVQGKKNSDCKGFRMDFAYRIGVHPRTLNRYCNEIHDVDTIAYIADVLGVSVEDMLFFDGEDVPYFFSQNSKSFNVVNQLSEKQVILNSTYLIYIM